MPSFWVDDDTRCLYCEAPLSVRHFNQKYCSRGCQTAFYKHGCSKVDAWANEVVPKHCERCNQDFFPDPMTRLNTWRAKRFCSRLCMTRANKRRYVEMRRIEAAAENDWDYGWFKLMHIRLVEVEALPCVQCDETNQDKLEVDHIIARCNGGMHSRDNLQVLCKGGHRKKFVKDMRIYAEEYQSQRLSVHC